MVSDAEIVADRIGAESEVVSITVDVLNIVRDIHDGLVVPLAAAVSDTEAVCDEVALLVRLCLVLLAVMVPLGPVRVTVSSSERDLLSVRWPLVDDMVSVACVRLREIVTDEDLVAETTADMDCVADRLEAVDDGSVEMVRVDVSVFVGDTELLSDT